MKNAVIFGEKKAICVGYTDERIKEIKKLVTLYPVRINQTDAEKQIAATEKAEIIFTAYNLRVMNAKRTKKNFSKAELLLYAAGSAQHFARDFLDYGIEIVSAWAANAVPVAEFIAAQILLANKGHNRLHDIYREEGHKKVFETAHAYPASRGAKIGILGVGMIGKRVISIIKNSGVTVCVYDPFLPEVDAAALDVSKRGLDEIFQTCNSISNHMVDLP